jgi:hypothetical protein
MAGGAGLASTTERMVAASSAGRKGLCNNGALPTGFLSASEFGETAYEQSRNAGTSPQRCERGSAPSIPCIAKSMMGVSG